MEQVRALYIPAEPERPIRVAPLAVDGAAYSAAVGGGFSERVILDDNTILLCNADGKNRPDLTANPRATRLTDTYIPGFAKIDQIHGPVLVIGFSDDGFDTHVPQDAVTRAGEH